MTSECRVVSAVGQPIGFPCDVVFAADKFCGGWLDLHNADGACTADGIGIEAAFCLHDGIDEGRRGAARVNDVRIGTRIGCPHAENDCAGEQKGRTGKEDGFATCSHIREYACSFGNFP